MQPDFTAAIPPEMRELSTSRQTWYVGRHANGLALRLDVVSLPSCGA